MKEGENDVYRMAKIRDKKIRDFNQIKCIKDESDRKLRIVRQVVQLRE
jgi:hypothetical protein